MLTGQVTADREVLIYLPVAGKTWPAIVDTGFNGSLELPVDLFAVLNPVHVGSAKFDLAAGQDTEQEVFLIDFPFDGRVVAADTTFIEDDTILIGTSLLREYRLEVDFVARTVKLDRVTPL